MCVSRKLNGTHVTCLDVRPPEECVKAYSLAGNLPASGARLFMEHNSVMNVFGWVMSCY